MINRIAATVSGRVPRGPVGAERDASELLWAIEEARGFVHDRTAPELRARILQQIHSADVPPCEPAPWWLDLCRRLLQPRTVAFQCRPAYGLACAAVLAVWMAFGPPVRSADQPTPSVGAVFVQFRLHAADASSVRLAGTFTGWQPDSHLHQVSPGVWTTTVLIPPGVHDYAYVVNGERWVADPFTPVIADGFGGQANRLALLPSSGSSAL